MLKEKYSASEALDMSASTPYFVWPLLSALAGGGADPEQARRLRALIALALPPEASARILAGDSLPAAVPADTYGDAPSSTPTQDDAPENSDRDIDDFIDRYGRRTDSLDITPAAGYIPETDIPDPMQRVRTLVAERQYEAALQIITGLYLNNPEKSIYFADQIRFLKKLILNASKF